METAEGTQEEIARDTWIKTTSEASLVDAWTAGVAWARGQRAGVPINTCGCYDCRTGDWYNCSLRRRSGD